MLVLIIVHHPRGQELVVRCWGHHHLLYAWILPAHPLHLLYRPLNLVAVAAAVAVARLVLLAAWKAAIAVFCDEAGVVAVPIDPKKAAVWDLAPWL